MKVVLAGYYGRQEKCDDLLECAVKQSCRGDIEWIRLEEMPHHNDIDMVILGGGSLLGYGIYIIDNLCVWLKDHPDVPFHILGTGARDPDLTPTLGNLKYLFNRAETCMVRGHSSRDRLEKIGIDIQREDVGDPIFLLKSTGDSRGGGYVGGVVRPSGNYPGVEDLLCAVGVQTHKPVKLFNFSNPQMDNQYLSHSYEINDLGLNESYNAIRDSYFWVGNRLHAFCIAINEGVPSIGVDIEFNKVCDVCTTLDYKYYVNDVDIPYISMEIETSQVLRARDNAAVLRERLKKRLGEITK